jgi:SAM-dependent methyltransferase
VLTFEILLERYLQAYWLRPVTALVRALEADLLHLWNDPVEDSVELACGDGTNGSIARGGELDPHFDVFQSVPLPSAESFFSGRLDVYDQAESSPDVPPVKVPKIVWKVGLDHKQNLLDKAKKLQSFRRLIRHDLNQPLPFESETLSFIFSNSIYWVKEGDRLLREIQRILRPHATAKFVIITPEFYEHMAWSKLRPYPFRDLIDMGRHTHYQQLISTAEWERKFSQAGLTIRSITPTFNKNLVQMIEFHDLREVSPLTAFMSRHLSPPDRSKVKSEWVNYMKYLFTSMYRDGFFQATTENSTYRIYTISK